MEWNGMKWNEIANGSVANGMKWNEIANGSVANEME